MNGNDIKKAAGFGGKTMAEVSRCINQSPANVHQKLTRNSFTDQELEDIAAALGCKYKCFFEFEDGVKIGIF